METELRIIFPIAILCCLSMPALAQRLNTIQAIDLLNTGQYTIGLQFLGRFTLHKDKEVWACQLDSEKLEAGKGVEAFANSLIFASCIRID